MKRVVRQAGVFLAASAVSLCVFRSYDSSTSYCKYTEFRSEVSLDEESGETEAPKSILVQQGPPGGFQRELIGSRNSSKIHSHTLRIFRDSIGDAWKSTVQILVSNRQVALGAVIHKNGWVVTKSSEVPDECDVKLADSSKAVGVVKLRRPDLDLAVIKIERDGLLPIVIDETINVPLGSWLISTSNRSTPTNVGVLSVGKRNIPAEKPVLGIRLGPAPSGLSGATIESVVVGGGADRAGIEAGDVIVEVEGTRLPSYPSVMEKLRSIPAGEYARVTVVRETRSMTFRAQMMDLPQSLFDSTEMEVNGEISSRATGFKNVLQHDTVLLPHHCGGPLVDIDGNFVGLNIARAGRVVSLAYSARELKPIIQDMLRTVGAEMRDDSRVVKASAEEISPQVNAGVLPGSVPASIQIESLKPEVVIPARR